MKLSKISILPNQAPAEKCRRGFTLVECVLALALGALLLIPLTIALNIYLQNFEEGSEQSELMQHARVAFSRIAREARYADSLVEARIGRLEFNTTTLEDADAGTIERIAYQLAGGALNRSVNGLPSPSGQAVAGTQTAANTLTLVQVNSFVNTPLKLDGAENLVPMVIPPDNIANAVAVRTQMNLADNDLDILSISTVVKLRNK